MKIAFDFPDVELKQGKVYEFSCNIEQRGDDRIVDNIVITLLHDKEEKALNGHRT
jgi:hypothetical protein